MRQIILVVLFSAAVSARASSQSALRTILEVQGTPGSNMILGTGIIGLGDINNDGWPDIAVSAGGVGKTFIYFGGPGILDGIPDVTLRGGANMVMGDLNGDGFKDLIIHWQPSIAGATDTIYVYFGKAASPLALDTVPGLLIPSETLMESRFGHSMACGDLNNDGFDDLVVGASSHGRGKVYVYMGKPALSTMPDFTAMETDTSKIYYGFEIRITDINGDGIADLTIGSGALDNSEKTLDIYFGREGWTFTKNSHSQQLSSISFHPQELFTYSLCDVNVDGKADLALFSHTRDSIFFFFGGRDSISYTPDLVFDRPDSTQWIAFAGTCFDIGDINGDGMRDFVLGAFPGGGPAATILIYFGLPNPVNIPVAVRSRAAVSSLAFFAVVSVGDVDGNGVNDFATVIPYEYQPITQDGAFLILSGDRTFTDVEGQTESPSEYLLSQNYPNPFNPETTIEFSLPKRSRVLLLIYDSLGREIRRFLEEELGAGVHKIRWDGRGQDGQRLASGPYYYQLIFDGKVVQTKKLLFLK